MTVCIVCDTEIDNLSWRLTWTRFDPDGKPMSIDWSEPPILVDSAMACHDYCFAEAKGMLKPCSADSQSE